MPSLGLSAAVSTSVGTNTNTCIGLLPTLAACGASLPSKACCDALNTFTSAGCFCNPLTDFLLGSSNAPLVRYLLLPVCAIGNPFKNWIVPCGPYTQKTYNGGTCSLSDVAIDSARIQNAIGFSTALNNLNADHYETQGCFNYTALLAKSKELLDDTFTTTVPFGVGFFDSFDRALEYLAVFNAKVTKDMWWSITVNATTNSILQVSQDGQSIMLGSVTTQAFLDGNVTFGPNWSETHTFFNGCSTKLAGLTAPATPALVTPTSPPFTKYPYLLGPVLNSLGRFMDNADYGPINICRFHTKYCSEKYPQYRSEDECVAFVASLPRISPVCGVAGALSGNSTFCRFKHQWMASINPEVHCPHIGYSSDMCADDNCGPAGPAADFAVSESVAEGLRAGAAAWNATVLANGFKWRFPKVC
ncbi:hypothetical protein DFJ73DRAFT_890797 [Zopfochytrium polystomum]|nr:hypothetical protein DFJ73DRAFT_890797 [Zopfochytrium polystomum]